MEATIEGYALMVFSKLEDYGRAQEGPCQSHMTVALLRDPYQWT